MNIDRRRFLALTGIGALAACDAQMPTTAPPPSTSAPSTSTSALVVEPVDLAQAAAADRVLVVVQLGGGNDGLNTLVPVSGRYHDLRPTLGLNDDTLIPVPGTTAYGLHPAFAPMAGLLTTNNVAMVEGIGYPAPSRSHFVALDTWWSASTTASTTGWLGRYLDVSGGTAENPMRAIALGSGSPALLGQTSRPTVVLSPQSFAVKSPNSADLLRAWEVIGGRPALSAVAALKVFDELRVTSSAASYSDDEDAGAISRGLRTAGDLIAAQRGAQIIYVSVGGFDTHAGQAASHQALLADLATGIASLFDRLDAVGLSHTVTLMTVSEFGRRAAENGSGTDHGKAGMQFVVGPNVAGGVYGDADLSKLADGDLAAGIDTRCLYADALGWLGVSSDEVLARQFAPLGLIRPSTR